MMTLSPESRTKIHDFCMFKSKQELLGKSVDQFMITDVIIKEDHSAVIELRSLNSQRATLSMSIKPTEVFIKE